MRILLLTQIVPYPPDSGPKVKTYHVLRYLAECGHQITLASFVRTAEARYLQDLQVYCEAIHPVPLQRSLWADAGAYASSLFSGLPFLVARDAKTEMFGLVRQLIQTRHYDIVHADQLTMAQFALSIRRSIGQDHNAPAIVFDAHNAVWTIVERSRQTAPPFLYPVLSLEARRVKRYEARLVHDFDHTLAVSSIDQQALLQGASNRGEVRTNPSLLKSKVSVIPITVDCQTLKPVSRADASSMILTVGTLFYPPNADGVRWFLQEVFPLVKQKIGRAELTIVGPRPPADLVQAGQRDPQAIHVTGYVPDLLPYFESAAVMVVPVRAGSGMRVRILEALARGMPVVTTTTGLEGIDGVHGEHVLVADEPSEFASAVAQLLEDQELGRRLGRNGRRLIEEKYDWQVALPKLEDVYRSLGAK